VFGGEKKNEHAEIASCRQKTRENPRAELVPSHQSKEVTITK
jgi:hypothetical protein